MKYRPHLMHQKYSGSIFSLHCSRTPFVRLLSSLFAAFLIFQLFHHVQTYLDASFLQDYPLSVEMVPLNQIAWSEDIKKSVWTEIVTEKIRKQAENLERWDRTEAQMLYEYIKIGRAHV